MSLNPSERNATFQLKRALKAEDECRALLDALERKDRLLDSLRKAFELVRKDVLNPEELNALGKLRIEAITKEIGA